jgi:hypothetical protein
MEYSENLLQEVSLGPIFELDGAEEGAKFSMSLTTSLSTLIRVLCNLCSQLTLSRLMS